MPVSVSNEQLLSYARANNWLPLWVSEGNILNVFLTPSGNMVEIYFEKNKVTLKNLPYYTCK
jgi:hypothetical protein